MDKLGPLANLEESYYQMILIPLGGLTVMIHMEIEFKDFPSNSRTFEDSASPNFMLLWQSRFPKV